MPDHLKAEALSVGAAFMVLAPSYLHQFRKSVQVLLGDEQNASDVCVKTNPGFLLRAEEVGGFYNKSVSVSDDWVSSEVSETIAIQKSFLELLSCLALW